MEKKIIIPEISILTFNILFENPLELMTNKSTDWKNRKHHVATLLKKLNTDIICLQECVITQLKFLKKELEKYKYYGALSNNLPWHWSDINIIFYKSDRFSLLNSGTNWYSGTPGVPGSKGYGNFIPRVFSWIILEDNELRLKVLVINTHLDVLNPESRILSVQQMADCLKDFKYEYDLLILAGDFNTVKSEKNIVDIFANNGIRLTDTIIWGTKGEKAKGTFNGFHGDLGRRIDYVLYSDRKEVVESGVYKVIDEKSKRDEFISDHFPVYFNIKLKDNYIKLL
jgi:endonuclease/exonuclease/phosphatase family metal-dependent hydrolase